MKQTTQTLTLGLISLARRCVQLLVCIGLAAPGKAQAQRREPAVPVPMDSERVVAAYKQDSVRRMRAHGYFAPTARKLADQYMMIPEYHDEQRLADAAGNMGPVVYLYASPHLASFNRRFQIREQRPPGALVAMAFVDTTAGAVLPNHYDQLGLDPGLNCVWLRMTGATYQVWVSNTTGSVCVRPSPGTGTLLHVYQTQADDFTAAADYPGAARFGEADNGQPLIGFRCFNAWCEAGPPGLTPTPPFLEYGSAFETIQGWHDDQRLEIKVGGRPMAGPRATLIPDKLAGTWSTAAFEAEWRPVARLFLHSAPPAGSTYERWGLTQGWHQIESRRMGGQWRVRVTPIADNSDSPAARGTARIWLNVREHPHDDAPVPGIVRFRYTTLDDGLWYPCGNKCCMADGGT